MKHTVFVLYPDLYEISREVQALGAPKDKISDRTFCPIVQQGGYLARSKQPKYCQTYLGGFWALLFFAGFHTYETKTFLWKAYGNTTTDKGSGR